MVSRFDNDPRWHALEKVGPTASVDPRYKDVKTPGVADFCNEILRIAHLSKDPAAKRFYEWCVQTILTIDADPAKIDDAFEYEDSETHEKKLLPPQVIVRLRGLFQAKKGEYQEPALVQGVTRALRGETWSSIMSELDREMASGTKKIEGIPIIEARIQVVLAMAGRPHDVKKIPSTIREKMEGLAPMKVDPQSLS